MKTIKVFISYSHNSSNNPILKQLLSDLKRNQIEYWIDSEQLSEGANIFSNIESAIADSDFFLYMISRDIISANFVGLELGFARSNQFTTKKPIIIPIKIETTQTLGSVQDVMYLDLWKNYEKGLESLLRVFYVNDDSRIAEFKIENTTDKTSIIDISSFTERKLIEHFLKYPDDLKLIDRRKFEELIAEVFFGFGYEVELTQKTRDGGKDIIAIKNEEVKVKYLIECKRPEPMNPVRINVVKNLHSTVIHDKATKGILASTTRFTKDSLIFIEEHQWILEAKDFNGIYEWLQKYMKIKIK